MSARLAQARAAPNLEPFLRDVDGLALLLIIIARNADPAHGLQSYVDDLPMRRRSRLTLLNFLRDQIEAGRLVIVEGDKKSRKTLMPSQGVLADLARLTAGFGQAPDEGL